MLRQENSPISRTDTLRQSCRGYTAQDEKEFFQKSSHHRFLWWLLVVGYDITDAPAELGAVVCPDSRTPVAVATGLRGQQVEQRVVFLQAEAGIRDYKVTGVQTCALPI